MKIIGEQIRNLKQVNGNYINNSKIILNVKFNKWAILKIGAG